MPIRTRKKLSLKVSCSSDSTALRRATALQGVHTSAIPTQPDSPRRPCRSLRKVVELDDESRCASRLYENAIFLSANQSPS